MIDETNESLAGRLVLTIGMVFIATWIGGEAASRMTKQATRYVTNSQFKITTGDEKELKAATEQRKTAITLAFTLLGVIIVNIAANLLAPLIVSAAKGAGIG